MVTRSEGVVALVCCIGISTGCGGGTEGEPATDSGGPTDSATDTAVATDGGGGDATPGDGGTTDTGATDSDLPTDTGTPTSDACIPTTCIKAGKDCGSLHDGCGGAPLACGTCDPGESCVSNVCTCTTAAVTVGPKSPTVADERGTHRPWSNIDEIRAADVATKPSGYASCKVAAGTVSASTTKHLVARDLAMAIPSGAKIKGITVEVIRKSSYSTSTYYIADDEVRVRKSAATSASNRAKPGAWGSGWTTVTYGGPNDLWGETWVPSDVNGTWFGAELSAKYIGSTFDSIAQVDSIKVTVTYQLCK